MTPAECLGIEDAKAGIQAILASGAQPVGVGRKEELGEGLPIVPETSALTFDYLKSVAIMKDNRITVTDIPNKKNYFEERLLEVVLLTMRAPPSTLMPNKIIIGKISFYRMIRIKMY